MTFAPTKVPFRADPGGLTVGTPILTRHGVLPVEQLTVGTQVLTKDAGYATLTSLAFHDVDLRRDNSLAPVRLSPNCFGPDVPCDDMFLAPDQHIALHHPVFPTMFGAREVLVAMRHLTDLPRSTPVTGLRGITYVEIGFDRPQIVLTGSIAVGIGAPNSNLRRPVLSQDDARQLCSVYQQRRILEPFAGILHP